MANKSSVSTVVDNSTVTDTKTDLTEREVLLVKWEEWALSTEEHYHALELWRRNPNGVPMGHHR
jgi:hypothetical protein